LTPDFKRVSTAHWRGAQKYKTFGFAQSFGGFSYAIQEKPAT